MGIKLKKGDKVYICSGKNRGKTGTIKEIVKGKKLAVVEGVNLGKRHTKPSQKNQQGGILEKELPIHVSNMMLVCPKTNKPTRVGFRFEDKTKIRYSKKTKEQVA